ncbi:MAG TPA: hypothetical protein DCS93_07055 [Microscillaceae bacterium]|nr:hypothetical protein [Microscillaceae bacterium]
MIGTIPKRFNYYSKLESQPHSLEAMYANGEVVTEDIRLLNSFMTSFSVMIHLCNCEFKGDLRFNHIHFEEKVLFNACVFEEKVIFQNCIFKQDVSYEKYYDDDGVNSKKTIFKKQVCFIGCTFGVEKTSEDFTPTSVHFKDVEFQGDVCFKETTFHSKVRFHNSIFTQSVDFENTVFNDLADFYYTIFESAQQFHLTDFMGITIFSNATFEKEVQFLHNKVSSTSSISFQEVEFQQALDISRANFGCTLSFFGAEINENPTELGLYESNEGKTTAYQKIRESFRIVKQTYTAEGNKIEAGKQNRNEMRIYWRELKASKGSPTTQLKWYERPISPRRQNLAILWFNGLSNRHGTSWLRGFVFTIIVAIPFFGLMSLFLRNQWVWDCSLDGAGYVIKSFLQFLNVTLWKYQPYGKEINGWAYFILFIGRLFVGYGIYQTVQAFRKFSKK